MFISFLGVGQGGSNISDIASKKGFYSAAINFSKQDLDSLEHLDKRLQLIGSDGIGKQRQNAIELMNNNWDLALNFVKENFSHSSIEIIFVPFATGGGSGSGISPVLLQLLIESMPDKTFVAMPILPSINESFISQRNCLETFDNLSTLDICILPIDNDKVASTSINIGKNKLYDKVNQSVISIFNYLLSYTNKNSRYGVMDKKDLRSIFSVRGLSTIAEVNLINLSNTDISEGSFTETIQESWKNTIFTDIEYEQILSSGFIFDGQESLMEFINLESIYSIFGNKMPISLYEGFYNNDKGGKVITVLTGLSWCNKRLMEIDRIIKETNELFNSRKQSPIFKSKISDISITTSKPKETKKVNDITSIINKFKR